MRQVIRSGKVLFVSTAQGRIGREVASLVGGTFLNVLDSIVREQEDLPAHERRKVTIVVDEMQTIPGADYESMLSELGKFGASVIMATQSLRRLDDLGETLRETLFANIGTLVAFQVSAYDARYLTWEFDRDEVTEADLTSLPTHHCYVRATVDGEKLPTFSMRLRPPEQGNAEVADAVRARAMTYTKARADIATRMERELEKYIREFREDLLQSAVERQQTRRDGEESPRGKTPGRRRSPRSRARGRSQGPLEHGDETTRRADDGAVGDMQDSGIVDDFLSEEGGV